MKSVSKLDYLDRKQELVCRNITHLHQHRIIRIIIIISIISIIAIVGTNVDTHVVLDRQGRKKKERKKKKRQTERETNRIRRRGRQKERRRERRKERRGEREGADGSTPKRTNYSKNGLGN
jgi:FtsZ-interacting cell division protein ZipA